MSKKCKSCLKVMCFDKFTKSKNVKDGYENKCKKCRLDQRKKHKIKCVECGESFKTAYPNSKYCSNKCKPQHRRNRVNVSCFICGENKEVVPSMVSNHKHFYCSDECKNKGYTILYSGKNHHNYNTIKHDCYTCGTSFERWKSQVIKYERSYCSSDCRSKDYKSRFNGKNNPNYDPLRKESERIVGRNIDGYQEWRRAVYTRDKFTCMCCGDNKGGNLVAHHIKNYTEHPELRTCVDNGITFCNVCHKNFHDKFGYKNNNKSQLIIFLRNKEKVPIPQ